MEERPGPPFCPNDDASTVQCPAEDDDEPSVIAAAAATRRRHHLHETTTSAFSSQQRRYPTAAAAAESFELGTRRRRDSASSTDSYMSWSAGQPATRARGSQEQEMLRHHRQTWLGATLPRGGYSQSQQQPQPIQQERRNSFGDDGPRYENTAFLRQLQLRSVADEPSAASGATLRGTRRSCRV